MQLCFWHPDQRLQANRYGIDEPISSNICQPTQHSLILLPLVAFDQKGTRLGMGSGYYDRLLGPCAETRSSPIFVGVAYDFQQVELIEKQDWDVPLDAVVTDREVIPISSRVQQS
jgi:5-formyltetrahydrofolate cyclo-ligase